MRVLLPYAIKDQQPTRRKVAENKFDNRLGKQGEGGGGGEKCPGM